MVGKRTSERAQPERDVGGNEARAERERRLVGGRRGRGEHAIDRGRAEGRGRGIMGRQRWGGG